MRFLVLCFLFPIFLIASPLPENSPETVGMSSQELEKIGPTVEKLISEKKLAGGSVLILRKGQIVYQKSFGLRDLEAGQAMANDTLFRIFSMTKGLASAAALILVEEGKLQLDVPISKYLPELENPKVWHEGEKETSAKRQPSVRDLLRHTGGYASAWASHPVSKKYQKARVPDRQSPLMKTVENLKDLPLMYEPGTQWVYGISSDLLAATISRVAGIPFEQFLMERLIRPLGMTDTAYSVPAEKVDRLAINYRIKKGEMAIADSAKESTYLQDPAFKGGGSGLVSTITDYARFLCMIANGGEFQGKRYLKKETVDLMRTNQLPKEIPQISFGKNQRYGTGFGLGFSVRFAEDKRWDPDAPVGEYGWGGAASTHYWISPKHDLIVITMEQTMPYNWNLEKSLKPLIYSAIRD